MQVICTWGLHHVRLGIIARNVSGNSYLFWNNESNVRDSWVKSLSIRSPSRCWLDGSDDNLICNLHLFHSIPTVSIYGFCTFRVIFLVFRVKYGPFTWIHAPDHADRIGGLAWPLCSVWDGSGEAAWAGCSGLYFLLRLRKIKRRK